MTSPDDGLEDRAISLMKEFVLVYPETSAGDMNIRSLEKSYGWLVSGHGHGMYTYVHPSELDGSNPDHILVGLHGRSKRSKDSKELRIIHINRKKTA